MYLKSSSKIGETTGQNSPNKPTQPPKGPTHIAKELISLLSKYSHP